MVKLQETPFNKEGNFFDYRILAKARNEHLGEYALPTDSKLKEINNIFIKNNYIPVDTTDKIYSEIPTISGIPILSPKVIVFGGFEYNGFGVLDNKILPCFKELLDKNLVDKILSYGDELSAVDEVKEIRIYCEKNNISFAYNDILGLQLKVRSLHDYSLFKKRAEHCSKEIEKKLKDFDIIIQMLSLEEVANAPYIAEELSKKNLPFVSYILDDVPH